MNSNEIENAWKEDEDMKLITRILACDFCVQFLQKMVNHCPKKTECIEMNNGNGTPEVKALRHRCIWNRNTDLFALCDFCSLKDARGTELDPQLVTLKPYYDVMVEWMNEKLNDDDYEPPEWLIEKLADTHDSI